MSNVSQLIFVAIAAYMIYALVQRGKATAAANETFAHMGARDVAARLGLSVVGGDPELNLMMLYHAHMTSDTTKRSDTGIFGTSVTGKSHGVTLEGTPNGRKQSFHYALDTEFAMANLGGRGSRRQTLRYALMTDVNAPFPEFEVVLRAPNTHLKAKQVFAHPAHPTGVPEVDAALIVYSTDARLAQLIGPLLVPLIGHNFVQVVGRGQRLEMLADHATSSYATYYLEDNAKLHHVLADAIERFAAG